jgi:6-phosphogluconolactonase
MADISERFRIYQDSEQVAQAAADYLFTQITSCVAQKKQCHVVLPGGSTPARCLQLLAEMPLPWDSIHWYPGDERCYPIGHAERNDTMILEKLFSRNHEAAKNLHAMPAQLGPVAGAEAYAELLNAALAESDGKLDIVLLGMGEDGHTASMFPGNPALDDLRSAVPVCHAPKPPSERISIGLNTLKHAAECIVIATGESKYDALMEIRQGRALPVSMVEPDVWFVDESAVFKNATDNSTDRTTVNKPVL